MAEVKRFKFRIYLNFQTVVNDLDTNDSFQTSYQIFLSRIQKWLGVGSGWMFELVDGDYINIFLSNPLAGSSYM